VDRGGPEGRLGGCWGLLACYRDVVCIGMVVGILDRKMACGALGRLGWCGVRGGVGCQDGDVCGVPRM
jgi:hypothetical protein